MNPSKVIFLDVDGVLNDMATEEHAPYGFIGLSNVMIANLKRIVDATDAKIVLTSTWKNEWSPNPEERDKDGEYLHNKLLSQGLIISDKTIDKISDRGQGIRRYLEAHPEVKQWIVLDDDVFPDYEECGIRPHMIKTSFYVGGLTEKLADLAIKKMELQSKNDV